MYRIGTATLSHLFAWFLHALRGTNPVPLPKVDMTLAVKFMSEVEIQKIKRTFEAGPQQQCVYLYSLFLPANPSLLFFAAM